MSAANARFVSDPLGTATYFKRNIGYEIESEALYNRFIENLKVKLNEYYTGVNGTSKLLTTSGVRTTITYPGALGRGLGVEILFSAPEEEEKKNGKKYRYRTITVTKTGGGVPDSLVRVNKAIDDLSAEFKKFGDLFYVADYHNFKGGARRKTRRHRSKRRSTHRRRRHH